MPFPKFALSIFKVIMNEEELKNLFSELVKATAEAKADEIRRGISETLGTPEVANLIPEWDSEYPGYFEVLATDPELFANQLNKFRKHKETVTELKRRQEDDGETVIKKVKETLRRVERLRPPMESGSVRRNNDGNNSRLLKNIINQITN
ncbi:hypothetical protein MASR1M107_12490 [Ignavibacteriales bacterium]